MKKKRLYMRAASYGTKPNYFLIVLAFLADWVWQTIIYVFGISAVIIFLLGVASVVRWCLI